MMLHILLIFTLVGTLSLTLRDLGSFPKNMQITASKNWN
jgi:hypothetical protein